MTKISPHYGPWVGGTAITVTGSGFSGATRVAVGGIAALSVRVVDDGTITCATPARPTTASPQAVVRVTTPAGTSGDAAGAVFTYSYPYAPQVYSTWPKMGPWEGGTTITLKGTGFLLASRVDVGGIRALSLRVIDDRTLTAVTPARPRGSTDAVAVRVTNPFGTSIDGSSGHFRYADPAPVRVTEVSPAVQPVIGYPQFTGGMETTVFGDNLDRVDHAEVAGGVIRTTYEAAYPAIPRIRLVVASSTAGPYDVVLVGRDGSRTPFTLTATTDPVPPVVAMVYTSHDFGGLTTGGTTVYVRGYFFGKTQPPTVTIGGIPVALSAWSDQSLSFVSPPHEGGTVEVVVTTPTGASGPSLHSSYTYFPPLVPKVTSMTPAFGPWAGGTRVTVRGSGFTGTTRAVLGGMTIMGGYVVDDTTFVFGTPARPVTASPRAVLRLTNPQGTSGDSLAATFLYTNNGPPTVSSVSPNAGPWAGGTPITVKGSAFTGATAVAIGGLKALSVTVVDDSTITCVTPARPDAAAAAAYVKVTTPVGTNSATSASLFTYVKAPAIDEVTPQDPNFHFVALRVAGGQQITITGRNLARATSVTLDGTPMASFSATDTAITAVTPAVSAAPGANASIVVTTPGGVASPSTWLRFVGAPTVGRVGYSASEAVGGYLWVDANELAGATYSIEGAPVTPSVSPIYDWNGLNVNYANGNLRLDLPPRAAGDTSLVIHGLAGDVTVPFHYTEAALCGPQNADLTVAAGNTVTVSCDQFSVSPQATLTVEPGATLRVLTSQARTVGRLVARAGGGAAPTVTGPISVTAGADVDGAVLDGPVRLGGGSAAYVVRNSTIHGPVTATSSDEARLTFANNDVNGFVGPVTKQAFGGTVAPMLSVASTATRPDTAPVVSDNRFAQCVRATWPTYSMIECGAVALTGNLYPDLVTGNTATGVDDPRIRVMGTLTGQWTIPSTWAGMPMVVGDVNGPQWIRPACVATCEDLRVAGGHVTFQPGGFLDQVDGFSGDIEPRQTLDRLILTSLDQITVPTPEQTPATVTLSIGVQTDPTVLPTPVPCNGLRFVDRNGNAWPGCTP